MLLAFFYPFIKFAFGTLYPAYKTWKSLNRKDETIRRRWMKYWVSFSVFQTLEYFADMTIGFILPFYLECKLSILMWLVHMRASSIIDSTVDKELKKHEKDIDSWLKRMHSEFFGVLWCEFTRFAAKFLTILLKSIAASHHVPSSKETNDQIEVDKCNNQLEYNISEDSLDKKVDISGRKLRFREWDQQVQKYSFE